MNNLVQGKIARIDLAKRPDDFQITRPGIYINMPEARYRADPCPVPSLNCSILKILIGQTPRHAWLEHARLNPDWEPADNTKFDLGKALHDVFLQGGDLVQPIEFADYKSTAAKEARAKALIAGRLPIIKDKVPGIQDAVHAYRAQLDRHEEDSFAFTNGRAEVVLIWVEIIRGIEIWCRCRLDWLYTSALVEKPTNVFHDFKSSGVLAGPDDWGRRQFFDLRYDLQDGFYCRGLSALLGIKYPVMRFVVGEVDPPFGLMVHQLNEQDRVAAMKDVEIGMDYWAWCMANKAFPGWPARVNYLTAPPYHSIKLEERIQLSRMFKENKDGHLLELAMKWYGPEPGEE